MAAPVTHIVLAQKVFSTYFANKDPREFFVGTSFPDIRYLGSIDREKTHFKGEIFSIGQIAKEDSFIAGMKFHAHADLLREKYITEQGIYTLFELPENMSIAYTTLKLLEDFLHYEKISNWDSYAPFFDAPLPQELNFVEEELVIKWHSILRKYLSQKPDVTDKSFATGLGLDEAKATAVRNLAADLQQNDKVVDIINSFYTEFDRLVNHIS